MTESRKLHVLLYGRAVRDTAEHHVIVALRRMGHTVSGFDPDERPSWLARARFHPRVGRYVRKATTLGPVVRLVERALVQRVRELRPDVVLVLALHDLTPPTVEAMRATGTKVVGWYQDHMVNFGTHVFLAAPYDALFFKDPHIVDRLRALPALDHVHYLPEGCEPSVQRPIEPTAAERAHYGCDVLLYGTLYPYRARLLEPLLAMNARVKLFGGAPPVWLDHPAKKLWVREELEFEGKSRALQCAKVVVSTSHFGEVRSVNARVFETAAMGAFQISDAPGVAEFFEPGVEIATFHPASLRETIEHWLARPDERAAIAKAGSRRAHAEHTFDQRLAQIFRVVGLA